MAECVQNAHHPLLLDLNSKIDTNFTLTFKDEIPKEL